MSKPAHFSSVIIVTHNSEKFFAKMMEALLAQTVLPKEIIVVDAASKSTIYLDRWKNHPLVQLIPLSENVGFCKGNNLAYKQTSPDSKYILFLNPDLFLPPSFLEEAENYLADPTNAKVGALTPPLLGYSIENDSPTGLYDSTGIRRSWTGFWYDRDQGAPVDSHPIVRPEKLKAICGALFFCRKEALEQVLLKGRAVFDPAFYMYKEDIDLSLRLRSKRWSLMLIPEPAAYHCRGWAKSRARKTIPRVLRLAAARNDCRIDLRNWSPYCIFSFLKWLGVKFLDV